MSPVHTRSRANQLLEKVVATGWYDRSHLAARLGTPIDDLEAYLAGEAAMPLEQQLSLAGFVIDEIPPLARAARQLRGQVVAAMLYESHDTVTHLSAPWNHSAK